MSKPRTSLISLMLALMLALPIAVITPAGAVVDHVTPDQQDRIVRDMGIGAPFGTWEERVETSRLYMHGQFWMAAVAPNPGGPPVIGPTGVAGSGNIVAGNSKIWALDTDRPDDCAPTAGFFCGAADSDDDDENPTTMAVGPAMNATAAKPDYPCREQRVAGDPFDDQTAWFASAPLLSDTTVYELTAHIPVDGAATVYFSHTDMSSIVVGNMTFAPWPPGGNYDRSTCIGSVDIDAAAPTATLDLGGLGTQLDGYTIPAGHTFNVIVTGLEPLLLASYLDDPASTITVDSAADAAFVDMVADTARINLWTEDSQGDAVINFPHPQGAATEERRIEFNALIADSLGTLDCPHQGAPGPFDPNDRADECPLDNFDQENVRFRVRDLNPEHSTVVDATWNRAWSYNEYVPLDQGLGLKYDPNLYDFAVRCCDLVTEPIQYNPLGVNPLDYGVVLMQYTFVYNQDFPPGRYQIEFHETGQRWKVYHEVHIGNTGWDFEFAPGEAEISADGKIARHTVRSNEPTEYILRATNTGARAETFSVSVPAPETPSLAVSVTPNTQSVQPGSHADFVVRVTPPTHGVSAGDKKVVKVQGVGLQAGLVHELVLETTYVGYNSFKAEELPKDLKAAGPYGVDIDSTRKFVDTRPGRTVSFGVVMRNLGTVADDFAVSPQGVPDGWTVNIVPSYVHTLAASREEFLVQVHAPVEAIPPDNPSTQCAGAEPHPGCDWTLYIRARRVADDLIQDVEEIPIHVILIDDFDISPLQNTILLRDIANNRYDLPEGQEGTGIHRVSQDPSHADIEFDDAALFRIKVENKGDREDTFPLTASWDPFVGKDEWGCEGAPRSGDGVPDGWRFRMLDHPILDPADRIQSFVPTFPAGPQRGGAGFFESGAAADQENGFSGEFNLGTITLPARSAEYVWVELHWVPIPDDDSTIIQGDNPVYDDAVWQFFTGFCTDESPGAGFQEMHFRDEQIARQAELRVTARSTNDPALRDIERLRVELVQPPAPVSNSGLAPGGTHAVSIEAGLDVVQPGVVPQPNRTQHTPKFYDVHVVNRANEHDAISVRVDAGKNGWTHRIADYKVVPSFITTEPVNFEHGNGETGSVGKYRDPTAAVSNPQSANVRPNSTVAGKGCKVVPDPTIADPLELTCYGMGAYDEIIVTVMTKPPFDARIGFRDDLPVTVSSRGPGDTLFTDTLVLQTYVQGDYFFELENLAGERKTYPGQSIAFPFTIHNRGAERDEYDIQIVEATPQVDGSVSLEHSWRPKLCGAHRVSVPGGYDYHGCLSATVPLDWTAGDGKVRIEENFRIRVSSTRGPVGNQQSGLVDFVALVEEPPGYLVESEAVTVRTGSDATFDVVTNYLRDANGRIAGEEYGSVTYRIDLETVPEGYSYTCTEESKKAAQPTCNDEAPEVDTRFFTSTGEAIGDMNIMAPEKQLGTSRVVSRIEVVPDNDPTQMSWHDAITNLASIYGVNLDVLQLREKRIAVCNDFINQTTAGIDVLGKCLDNRGRFTQRALDAGAVEPSLIIKPGQGHSLRIDLLVENPGLSPETVKLRNSPLPDGWVIDSSDATGRFFEFQGQVCPNEAALASRTNALCLEPLSFIDPELGFQDPDVMIKPVVVSTEQFLDAGDVVTLLFFAEVVEDPTAKAQIAVPIVVGSFQHSLDMEETEAIKAAPQEIVTYTAIIGNTGNVPDTMELTVLPPPSYASMFVSEFIGPVCKQTTFNAKATEGARCQVSLLPGENASVQFTVEVPETAAPNTHVPIVLESRSVGAGTKNLVKTQVEFTLDVLEYVWMDIDGDGFREFAVDRNSDPSDGFEEFRENKAQAGVRLTWLDARRLAGYLSDEALEEHTVTDIRTNERVLRYFVDGDGDGRHDHLLDRDGDGLPDIYFDPYHRYKYEIGITTDVTYDGVREFFFDVNLDCRLDSYLDITRGTDTATGRFHPLLQVHTDDDDFVDYVIDLDGDGNLDPNEIVIKGREQIACDRFNGFTQIGQIIRKVDMNGDGELDTVIDTDGDGDPDQFIPYGQKNAIPITLEDVTGDNRADWTYPSTGAGKPDSYYDPYEQRSGFIDAESQFVKDLKNYWWVAGLFVFVLLLFAVLVAVTRR